MATKKATKRPTKKKPQRRPWALTTPAASAAGASEGARWSPRLTPIEPTPIDPAAWAEACWKVSDALARLAQLGEDGGIRKGDTTEIVDFDRAHLVAHAAIQTMRGTLPGEEAYGAVDPRQIAKRDAALMKAYEALAPLVTHPTETAVDAVIEAALVVQATETTGEQREDAARELLKKLATLAAHRHIGDLALVPVALVVDWLGNASETSGKASRKNGTKAGWQPKDILARIIIKSTGIDPLDPKNRKLLQAESTTLGRPLRKSTASR